ncbi:MAG: 50S ribosomal protein L20 [Micavibrio aeruginosavorus]|uniref:Large ribosomal subunit protein bL20 n=1 Tax=Micavibrio aeruginosavorus TaxID=349221 RepID=A0A7T5R309_9BACT|nr:MAG: 50S ribosomal protein L20 [Micavibrio aeruginosavorus]
MSRVKSGPKTKNRHQKVLKLAKGHYGRRKNCYKIGANSVERALAYAYKHRRERKRDFRALWIMRINAAARLNGLTYSQFMHGLKLTGLQLDRKVLADIAVRNPDDFKAIAKQAGDARKKAA